MYVQTFQHTYNGHFFAFNRDIWPPADTHVIIITRTIITAKQQAKKTTTMIFMLLLMMMESRR